MKLLMMKVKSEQILCRVPVLEPLPFASTTPELYNELKDEMMENIQADDHDHQLNVLLNDDVDDHDLDILLFIASDAELAEFAGDVESLLGTGISDDICEMEELGVAGKEDKGNNLDACFEDKRVKVEDQDHQEVRAVIACHFDPALDMARESLNWNFHFSSALPGEEEEVKVTNDEMPSKDDESKEEERRMMLLKLNYETVITAWASQGSSPWADGTNPEFNSDDCWPDFMEINFPFLFPLSHFVSFICQKLMMFSNVSGYKPLGTSSSLFRSCVPLGTSSSLFRSWRGKGRWTR